MQRYRSCSKRQALLSRVADSHFDVAVVGCGINGAASAAALAAAGVKVVLFEGGDFASGTSQESSNLAWGGIKYLENGEIGLVRGLCRSRNRLVSAFPRSVPETRFLLSHEPSFRHGLRTLYAGSWLYWVLGQRATRAPRRLTVDQLEAEAPVVRSARFDGALEYSDACFLDGDARFVFGFVRRAWQNGAVAVNYLPCRKAEFRGDRWRLSGVDLVSGSSVDCSARVLINACGPWNDQFADLAGVRSSHSHVFSKGVHLVVPRIESVHRVLAFFADDGRLFFAIPMGNRTCIGTTDTRVDSPEAVVTDADRAFILENVNARLALEVPLRASDVIAERCGVRPLVVKRGSGDGGMGDWLQMSRKHVLDADPRTRAFSVYGGKLTDCINIGHEVAAAVGDAGVELSRMGRWYGEDDPNSDCGRKLMKVLEGCERELPPLPTGATRFDYLWRRYGGGVGGHLAVLSDDPSCLLPVSGGCDVMGIDRTIAMEDEFVVAEQDWFRRRTLLSLCADPLELELLD